MQDAYRCREVRLEMCLDVKLIQFFIFLNPYLYLCLPIDSLLHHGEEQPASCSTSQQIVSHHLLDNLRVYLT
jgi:hypothetical protein